MAGSRPDRWLRAPEPNPLLSAFLAINLHPGETAQALHYDDGFYSVPRPRPAVGVSTIWALDDFTETNGATEVIPGSRRADAPPVEPVATVKAVMPAGSVLVMDGRLWHRGGAHRSKRTRLAITAQYCQPWARQQETMMLAVPPTKASRFRSSIRAMLGYSIHPPFMGHVDGMHPLRLLGPDHAAEAGDAGQRAAEFWQELQRRNIEGSAAE